MTKKKIILLGVVSFLLIVFFSPRQIDTFYHETDSDGDSNYYLVPWMRFLIFDHLYEEYEFDFQPEFTPLGIPPMIIGEKQLLMTPHELTHEERFDILNSATCEQVISHDLHPCYKMQAQGCYPYYSDARYDYCMSIYDETSFSDEECHILQDNYHEYWWERDTYTLIYYKHYDEFEEKYCKR